MTEHERFLLVSLAQDIETCADAIRSLDPGRSISLKSERARLMLARSYATPGVRYTRPALTPTGAASVGVGLTNGQLWCQDGQMRPFTPEWNKEDTDV